MAPAADAGERRPPDPRPLGGYGVLTATYAALAGCAAVALRGRRDGVRALSPMDLVIYGLATERFGCAPSDISFQSSNRWDIAGAKAFGFRCVWVNRTGAPDEYPGLQPDRAVRDLKALLE